MSRKYYNKATHNKHFLDTINNDYPEDFFDWKVTVQFYSGLHQCYCVLESQKIQVEESHSRNIKNLKEIDEALSRNLFTLYKNSRQSRYDGFLNDDAMLRINKINFNSGNSILKLIESTVPKYYKVNESV